MHVCEEHQPVAFRLHIEYQPKSADIADSPYGKDGNSLQCKESFSIIMYLCKWKEINVIGIVASRAGAP